VVLKNKIKIIYFFVLAAANIFAQEDKPAASSGAMNFYFDKSVFYGNESQSYCEFYLMFYADELKYSQQTPGKGELEITALIDDKTGSRVDERNWILEVTQKPEDIGSRSKVIYDQWNNYLTPGEYQVNISVRDINSDSKGEIKSVISIPEISGKHYSISEIEFVSSVDENKITDQFRKGNRSIVPNPSRRYGLLNPTLLFYYELYSIPFEGEKAFNYTILKEGTLVETQSITSTTPEGKAAILHGLNVRDIPSGVYSLEIRITDPVSEETVSSSRRFEILQAEKSAETFEFSTDESSKYEALIRYLAPDQLDRYKSLSNEGKGNFLLEYWKRMDPSPGTAENEFMKTIQQRFIYAEKNFGWAGIKGWQTDMGRITIKYGIPNEVNQYNSEADFFAYQVWIYHENREYQFVFGDLQNNGRYILLHSNREGEISNPYWKEQIRKL
jgi:GWxTD domain-containing protein